LTQLGITVAFGVLLDALVVRSILVPALTFELGERVWWPSALSRRARRLPASTEREGTA
jgi:RND superfamily putative drug exporter